MNNTITAFITRSKSRLKTYGENVYVKNGENFEIELFNGHTDNVMAKIWINNKLISESGLVLKPGQRYFLERFIDSNNKFKYETYAVDGSVDASKAIANNGLVKVEFYKEKVWQNPVLQSNIWQQPYLGEHYGSFGLSSIGTSNIWCGNSYANSIVTNNSNDNVTFTSNTTQNNIETGRIEKGEASDQSFVPISRYFESFAFARANWHILPQSIQPMDVTQLRNYCAGCGTRVKKQSWKFCPSCGETLD
jgi:hypothetical protein